MGRGKAREWVRGVGMAAVLAASATAYGQGAPVKGSGAPAGTGAAPTGTGAASADPKAAAAFQEASNHYKAGGVFLDEKKYDKAMEELKAAYAVLSKGQIAGWLGEAEFQMKRYRDAAEHLEKFLREPGALAKDAAYLKKAEGWLAAAKQQVATLKVTVVPPPGAAAGWDAGMELLVDGSVSGLKGPLPPEVYVEEGKRTIGVRAGGARDEVSGSFQKGTVSPLTLTLKEAGPVAISTGTATPTASETGSATIPVSTGPRREPLIIGGVVAGAAAVAGAVTLGLFFGKAGELQTWVDQKACGEHDCYQAARDGNMMGRTSMWLFVGAGLVGLGTLGYWKLAPQNGTTGSTELRVGGGVGPSAGRLMLEGSW